MNQALLSPVLSDALEAFSARGGGRRCFLPLHFIEKASYMRGRSR